jgi:hypothetical protein
MRPLLMTWAAAALLLASLIVFGMLHFPERWPALPFQWWIHVGVIVVGITAFRKLGKLRKAWVDPPFRHSRGIPRWAPLLGVVALVIAVPLWAPSSFDLGRMPDGSSVHQVSYHIKDGKYFERLNGSHDRELSLAEYQAAQRKGYLVFSRGWVLFASITLLLWHYIWRRQAYVDQMAVPPQD